MSIEPRDTATGRPAPRRRCRRRSECGTTLVELIISIVIISIAVAGVMVAMTTTTGRSAHPMVQHQAVAVAEAYLEEIVLQNFSDPDGSEAGENRASFDDVDDYDSLANNGCLTTSAQCPSLGDCACDQNGDPIDRLAGYTVTVAVADDGANLGPGGSVNNNRAKRIDVTVQHTGTGLRAVLSGYRTCYPTGDCP